MQTLPAGEIKRRGLAALDGLLAEGPVHLLRHNRPACVVLSSEDYARLLERAGDAPARPDVWSLMLASAAVPGHDRAALDAGLAAEREGWDGR